MKNYYVALTVIIILAVVFSASFFTKFSSSSSSNGITVVNVIGVKSSSSDDEATKKPSSSSSLFPEEEPIVNNININKIVNSNKRNSTQQKQNNNLIPRQQPADFFTEKNHKLIFFGDSNSLGMTYLGNGAGWHLLGSYAKFILQFRQKHLSKTKHASAKNNINNFPSSVDNDDENSSNAIIDELNPFTEQDIIIATNQQQTLQRQQVAVLPNNSNTNNKLMKIKNFSAPSSVFALGGTALAGRGRATSYQKTKEFKELFPAMVEKLVKRNINNKNETSSPALLPITAFIMFGTNDCMIANSLASMKLAFMRKTYKSFIFEEIFKPIWKAHQKQKKQKQKKWKKNNNDSSDANDDEQQENKTDSSDDGAHNSMTIKIKRIVILTPPRILSNCSKSQPYCSFHNLNILDQRVVPMIRKIVSDYNSNKTNHDDDDDNYNTSNNDSNSSSSSSSNNSTMNEIIRKHRKNGVQLQLVDIYKWMTDEVLRKGGGRAGEAEIRKYYQKDGVHLNQEGHAKVARLVWLLTSSKRGV